MIARYMYIQLLYVYCTADVHRCKKVKILMVLLEPCAGYVFIILETIEITEPINDTTNRSYEYKWDTSYVKWDTSHVKWDTSYIKWDTSYIKWDTSYAKWDTS